MFIVLETNTGDEGEALEISTLVPEMNVLKTHVQTSATHTQLATSDFQTDLMLR